MVTHTLFFRILTLWLNFQYFWKSDNGSELRNFSMKSIRIYTVCAVGVQKDNYRTMLTSVSLEKLPQNEKLVIARIMTENIWYLPKILELIR